MGAFTVKSANESYLPPESRQAVLSERFSLPDNRGEAYVVAKLTGRAANQVEIITQLFKDELRAFENETSSAANIPRRFEQIIQRINEALQVILDNDQLIRREELQVVIGVIAGDQVFVTGQGKLHALFLHRTIKQRYVIYELDAQLDGGQDEKEKFFSTILDGELHPGDVFYVATRVSARELDIGELHDIVVTLPPQSALQRIKQHLAYDTAYAAACFQVLDDQELGPPKKINPLTSLEQLSKTKEDTSLMLGDQTADVSGWLGKITSPLLKRLSAPGTRGARSTGRRFLRSTIKILTILLSVFIKLFSQILSIFRLSIGTARRQYQKQIVENKLPTKIKNRAFGIPLAAKIGVAMVLVLMMAGGWYFSKSQDRALAQRLAAEFASKASQAEEAISGAEASLIYGNAAQSRELLAQAEADLHDAQPTNDADNARLTALRASIEKNWLAVRGITLATPATLSDLSTVVPGASWQTSFFQNGSIYGLTNGGDLYQQNEVENKLDKIEVTKGTIGPALHAAVLDADRFVVSDASRHLGLGTLSTKTINPAVSGADKLTSIEDLETYNGNLYILTAATKQVVKMRPQASSFDAGTAWITANTTDLARAVAITIDSSIYVLLPDRIIKLTSGKEQPFNSLSIDPPLTQAVDIWTSADTQELYLLDTENGRVIVLKKDGTLITQYQSDDFKSGKNIFVNFEKRIIYIVTDTKILSFGATHLVN